MAFAKLYLVFGTLSMECILVFWMVFLVLGTVLGIFNIVFGIWESLFGNLDSVGMPNSFFEMVAFSYHTNLIIY